MPAKDCSVPPVDLVGVVKTACATPAPQIGYTSARSRITGIQHLDVPLVVSTAQERANFAAGNPTSGDISVLYLAEECLAEQPPAIAAVCPLQTVARWSAHPALMVLAGRPIQQQQAVLAQLLQAALPDDLPDHRPHASVILAGSLKTEPAVEQLMLLPAGVALAERSPHLPTVLADLGLSRGVTARCPAAEPPLLVQPGGPTFEHFAALDLRLDRTQPPTLPLPEVGDGAEATQHSAGPHA